MTFYCSFIKKYLPYSLGFIIIFTIFGCAPRVRYGDAGAVETLTIDFGSSDLQMVAEKMVSSLLVHPATNDRPVIYVSKINNKTAEHIDTKSITDKIKTALLKSGKVRFTAISDVKDELIDQLKYQNQSGMVDSSTSKKIGRQIGADFILYGTVMSITKKAGRTTDVYYKFTLELADLETGLIEWAEEKEFRKGAKKAIFGY